MKTKRPSRKSTQPEPPPANALPDRGEGIPPALAHLKDKSPKDIALLLSRSAGMSEVELERRAGFLSGLGVDLGVVVPDWAREASKRFFAGMGIELATEQNPKEFGKMLGLMERAKAENYSAQFPWLDSLIEWLRAEGAKAEPEQAKAFFAGRAAALAIVSRVEQPNVRAKVFASIAARWRDISRLKSTGELHRWLIEKKIILPATDAAETRKVCRVIGLHFRKKAGKPPKRK